jgi:hypothetical protein
MVYVFKTSVKFKKQIKLIAAVFDNSNEIKKWNFDLEDCDKILRIEATKLNVCKIVDVLHFIGCSCIELK